MATIAWIGLGHMGGPMSGNLVAAGHDVRGVDPDPACRSAAAARGVRVVESIAEAVAGADAVFTSLPRDEHVREVLGGDGRRLGDRAERGAAARHVDGRRRDVAVLPRDIRRSWASASWTRPSRAASPARPPAASRSCSAARRAPSPGRPARRADGGPRVPGRRADHGHRREAREQPHALRVAAGPRRGLAARGPARPRRGDVLRVASVSSGDSWPLRTWYPVPGVVRRAPRTATSTPRSPRCSPRRTCRSRSPQAKTPGCTCRPRTSRSTSSCGSSTRGTAARTAA